MRSLLFIPPALLVSLLLFLLMAHLAGAGRAAPADTEGYTAVNLHRLTLDLEVQVRERESLPPPDIQPEQPPTPTVPNLAQPVAVNTPPVALNMPTPVIEMGLQVNAAVDLSAVAAVAVPSSSTSMAMNLNVAPVARMNPQYPRRALSRRLEGFVVAEFTVDAKGRVLPDSFMIIEASPAGVFEGTVERALLRWRFNPLIESGSAVPFRTRQRLEFKLE